MYFKTLDKSECCGCSACINICPKNCISFRENEEGFMYPAKDMDICINCGLCEKVCPFSDGYIFENQKTPSVYAAYDKQHRVGSSSGGIFFTLAKYAIEVRKGWVFGASFEENFQLRHIGVNNMEELQKLRGSKYIQSDLGKCYKQIRQLLSSDTFVLFVGTPCQVAGLRAFLRNKDYKNLLLVDLVCHGVPPQSLFDKHVKYLEKKHRATLNVYQFRKADGWGGCETAYFINPTKSKILNSYELSPYLYSFMYAMTYRESCYQCKFAHIPRQGDITLADFWGVSEFFPEIDASKGVSLVLLNNVKGEDIWRNMSVYCDSYISSIENASKYNGNLIKPSERPDIRNDIFIRIENEGYDVIARTLFKSPNYLKNLLKNTIICTPGLNIIHRLYRLLR